MEGDEPGEGSGLNGGRGPRANAPPPPPFRAWQPGEKPLGGGGAFKTKKCGVEPGGRGWRGKRRRCGRGSPAARFPLSPPRGTPPTPTPAGTEARSKREEAVFGGCFPVHFCRPGGQKELPLRCPACLQCTQPRFPCPLCSGGLCGGRAAKVYQKAQTSRNLPRSRATRVRSWPRPPRPSAPSARRAKKLARPLARSRELEPAQVTPPPRRGHPAPGPRAPAQGGRCTRAVDLANTPL